MITILLSYYNRPILLRRALHSLVESHAHHQDWRVVVGDDNSPIPAEPIVRDVLGDLFDHAKMIRTSTSVEQKLRSGSEIGRHANEQVLCSGPCVVITLCDDDRLHPEYLRRLDEFYSARPEVMYAYCDIAIENPLHDSTPSLSHRWNVELGGANPCGVLDASQVSFRSECIAELGVRFPESTAIDGVPFARNLDGTLYDQLYRACGPCLRTGILGQYKGVHDHQLLWNKKNGEAGFRRYLELVEQLGGKVF